LYNYNNLINKFISKMKKVLSLVFAATLLVACNNTEEVVVEEVTVDTTVVEADTTLVEEVVEGGSEVAKPEVE
jgi:uncharacterized protein YcfL